MCDCTKHIDSIVSLCMMFAKDVLLDESMYEFPKLELWRETLILLKLIRQVNIVYEISI